jgi:hypothetical protein
VEFDEIFESKPIPDPCRKTLAAPYFLANQAKDIWQCHYHEREIKEGLKYAVPENETQAARKERELQIA